MLLIRLGTALALASAAQPALCATFSPDATHPAFGVAAKAYLHLPLDQSGRAQPAFGLATAVSRQDHDLTGLPRGMRRDAETVGLRFGFDGQSALTLAGAPVRDAGAGRHNLRWQTAALVAGGVVLVAGGTFLYLLHEAEEHSD
jgi:hypothetical protein